MPDKFEANITSGFYDDLDKTLSAQRCFNMRPYISSNEGISSQRSLKPIHGYTNQDSFPGVGSYPNIRGMIKAVNNLYVMYDDKIERAFGGSAVTLTGAGGNSFNRYSSNGEVIAIINPEDSQYTVNYYDLSTDTVSTIDITDATYLALVNSVGGAVFDVTHIDGYFIFCGPTGMFSGNLVTTTKGVGFGSTLDFINTRTKDDELRAVVNYQNRLMAWGEKSVEQYRNTESPRRNRPPGRGLPSSPVSVPRSA